MDMCVELAWKVSSVEVKLRDMLPDTHRRSQGEPTKILAYIVILHFKRPYPKQNSAIP